MNTRRIVYIAIFVALICVGGMLSVPIPFTQIEISLSTLFVIMSGLVLGRRDGALAVLIYIVMGLLGLPVFTQGGGVGYVFNPSFGYLIGFVPATFLAGLLCERLNKKTTGKVFAAALIGMIPIYLCGITYQVLLLHYYIGNAWAAALAGVPAVLFLAAKDGVLLGVLSSVYPALYRALRSVRREKKSLVYTVNENNAK